MAIASKFLPRVKKKVISVEKLLDGSVAAEKKKIEQQVRKEVADKDKAEKDKNALLAQQQMDKKNIPCPKLVKTNECRYGKPYNCTSTVLSTY